ncbi:helix-turn-helix domain-containing protein [Micromonospora sonneratiae]|uniref:Helix-turn-helix domain-containing protein n=1 Tax=Micromonospora sonneratiae TaxID=1184706 RepID=A0ABW3YDI0_9ACTN
MMFYYEGRTDVLPTKDRQAWWQEWSRQTIVPTTMQFDQDGDYRAAFRCIDLGGVRVSWMSYQSMRYHRSAKLVRQSDPEFFYLAVNLAGRLGVALADREAVLDVRELTLYDTSRPMHGRISDEGRAAVQVLVQVPRSLVSLPANSVDRLIGVRLPGRAGMGGLLTAYLVGLIEQARCYQPGDAVRLSTATVDLATALLAHHLDVGGHVSSEAHQRVLRYRIDNFIQRHLGHPGLSPAMIATAHGISQRYLYKLFHAEDLTVAAWIRHCRLERCCRDLADPRLRTRPIHTIAARWGFSSNAHFTRLFRAVYQLTPGEFRQRTLSSGEPVHDQSTTVQRSSMNS